MHPLGLEWWKVYICTFGQHQRRDQPHKAVKFCQFPLENVFVRETVMVVAYISNEGNGGSLENGYLTQFFDFVVRSFDKLFPSFHLTSGKNHLMTNTGREWRQKCDKKNFWFPNPLKKATSQSCPHQLPPRSHFPIGDFRITLVLHFGKMFW